MFPFPCYLQVMNAILKNPKDKTKVGSALQGLLDLLVVHALLSLRPRPRSPCCMAARLNTHLAVALPTLHPAHPNSATLYGNPHNAHTLTLPICNAVRPRSYYCTATRTTPALGLPHP